MFKRWADLHTRLFPLWYGLAKEASDSGAPILRSPALHYPDDTRLHDVKDAYLIGDALYVAPVVTASTAVRRVYLPRGTWFDFFDAASPRIEGGRELEVPAPLDALPVFARAGAIVPMVPAGLQTAVGAKNNFTREVIVWLGAPGVFTEAGGGEYELSVAAPPPGSGRMMMTARGDSVTCPIEQHCLKTSGFDSNYEFTFDFRW